MLNFLCRQAITGSRKQVFAPEVKGHRKTGPFSPQEVAGGSGCGNNQPRVVDVCKMLLVVSVFTSRCCCHYSETASECCSSFQPE